MKPHILHKASLALAALVLLCAGGCGTTTAGASQSSSGGGWHEYLLHDTLYELPDGWENEFMVQGGGSYHYPPDGGMVFVSPASYGTGDLSFEDEAYAAMDYFADMMSAALLDYELLHTEKLQHRGHYALLLEFHTQVNGALTRGQAFFYADSRAKEVYQYLFIFPAFENGELERNLEEIISRIR